MNEKFTSPECETIIFDNEDVITVSLGGDEYNLPGVEGLGE